MKLNGNYQPLENLDEQEKTGHYPPPRIPHFRDGRFRSITFWALLLSVLFNIVVCLKLFIPAGARSTDNSATKFAGLVWDTPGEFEHQGRFDSKNLTLTEESWENLSYDLGSIAISDDEVASFGLPKAQRFPWDGTKGLYFLNGYHGIHCLKILRTTLKELHQNQALTFEFAHSSHCLEALLQDTICFADDTPRFTSFEHPGSPGFGQHRVCRNWTKLEEYSKAHTACWRDIEPAKDIDTLLRYRYCPPDSPYNQRVHEIFGDFDS